MGQAKNNKSNMGFTERLQSDASDIVRIARWLVDNEVAEWKTIDDKDIGLVFSGNIYELADDKLQVKSPKGD